MRLEMKRGELLNQLDPRAVRALKRRLTSGQITPRLFKDILRRQMVRYYFQKHPHAGVESWFGRKQASAARGAVRGKIRRAAVRTELEEIHHKHF